ncbi:hypothetical protein F5883DRAFT_574537 [Diaporthe sp. PMI_573]|nr:hypothetical protein F5883DRAFT_574537 [Diaporthaceae sp. PMI_573]
MGLVLLFSTLAEAAVYSSCALCSRKACLASHVLRWNTFCRGFAPRFPAAALRGKKPSVDGGSDVVYVDAQIRQSRVADLYTSNRLQRC